MAVLATPAAVTGRVFVSYSHDDIAWRDAFREMLAPALERYGVELWADDHIRIGDRWERVIGDALANCQLGLLLVTAAHLVSSFSWETEVPELVAAGVPIAWVLVEDCLWDDKELLRSVQGVQDPSRDGPLSDHPNQASELARICRKIRDQHLNALPVLRLAVKDARSVTAAVTAGISAGRRGAVLGAVPARPAAFVGRGEELGRVRAELVSGSGRAVGVAARPTPLGLAGRGGIGKTVLAAELTRDLDTLAYFPDGVFWLSLGERPDVVAAQRLLAGWLGGDAGAIRSPLQGAKVLGGLAADRQCLVVLDDVWSVGVAQALAVTGPKGRLLLTTRDERILERFGAATVSLDVLGVDAACDLLGQLTSMASSELPVEAGPILDATGRVALAVALVGAAIGRGGQSWQAAAARLAGAGEVFAGHPYADIFKALEVATMSLGDDDLAGYQALACFPEDTIIPAVTIGRLWGLAGADLDVRLGRLADLRLARLESGGVAFHDLERDYLLLQAQATAAAHEQLLAAHQPPGGDWSALDAGDPYLWDRLAYHLAAAGRHLELVATMVDPAWLAVRIGRDGTLAAERDLSEALRWEPGETRLRALLRRVQQTAPRLDRAARADAVVASLGVALWPLRATIDLTRLGTVSAGSPVISWIADTTSAQLIRTIVGPTNMVSSVAWSPDGARLASGGVDASVRVWDVATGTELHTLEGHNDWVRSVAWSPDGTRLASGGSDATVRVWDAATGTELHTLEGHNGSVYSVAWSHDGARLASGGVDATVRVWDSATGTELHTLEGHNDSVSSVAWSPDGTRLASGGSDATVRVWDAATGTELHTLEGHNGSVSSVAWSPDGARLASGGVDATVRVWDSATGTELHTLEGHSDWVRSVAWSPDGARLASGGATVRVWDAATGTELHTLEGHNGSVNSVAWSPDGARLASGGVDASVRVWDAATGAEPHVLAGHTGSVSSVAWSPDGARLASGGGDATVRVWDAATGAEPHVLAGHTGSVYSVAWSPDGARLASGGGDATVRVWDAATGAELHVLAGHTGSVYSVAWSPDGARLASGGGDATVRVWDTATGTEPHVLAGHTGWVNSVAWSPDGARLASGGDDATVRVWDTATGTEPHVLAGHTGRVTSVAWSPDGTRLASGGDDATVRVWDTATGTELHTLEGQSDWVRSVAWSPDGTRLASGGGEATVRVWDTATARNIHGIVTGFSSSCIDYSPNGALAVGVDRSVMIFSP